MKKTLQEETKRILEISKKLTENLYADDYGAKRDLEQLQRDEMGYGEEENPDRDKINSDDDEITAMHKSISNYWKDNPVSNTKNPIWADIDEFIKGCKKEGMDNNSIKSEIMKYVDTLLPNDEDEGPDANDIDSDGNEYGEQYNKNMTQGFKPNEMKESDQQINELGFDTPVTVTQEVIKVLESLIGSPEFLQKVIDHVGGAKYGITPEKMGARMGQIIDQRLKEIIHGIPKILERGMRGYKPIESSETNPHETDEYGEQYDKNMSQGFSSINEGNAFVGAAKKAKEEGKDSFVLDGKTYKVTVSKSKK